MYKLVGLTKMRWSEISGALFGRDASLFAWSVWANKLWGREMPCKQRFYLGEILHNDTGNKRNATSSTFGMICFIKSITRKCLLSVQRGRSEASLSLRWIVLTQCFGVISTFVQIHMTCWCICSIFAQVCIFNELRKTFVFQLFLFSSCFKYLYDFTLVITKYKIHVSAIGIVPLH